MPTYDGSRSLYAAAMISDAVLAEGSALAVVEALDGVTALECVMSAGAEPVVAERVVTEPVGAEPVGAEPVGAELEDAERVVADPAGAGLVGVAWVGESVGAALVGV